MKNELLVISIFLLCFNILSGQNERLYFEDASLVEVFKKVQDNSQWVFSYNPEVVAPYEFSGAINNREAYSMMAILLKDTPFSFKVSGRDIIVYEEPKTLIKLCGHVVDQENQTALEFVSIFSDDQINGTSTDENGYFELSFEAIDRQEIFFKYIGYQEKRIQIKELLAEENCPTISLNIDLDLFDSEIIVTDYILDGITEGEDYSKVRLDYNRLTKNHSQIEHDLLKTVQFLPGIVSLDGSATNLQIRGGTADQNLILWEDTPMYGTGHMFGMISAINPFVVNSVEVHKGVYKPSYDNRVGGVIDMSLSDSIANSFHGGVGATFTEGHAFVDVPVIKDKLSFILSGRHSYNGLWETPTISNYSDQVFQGTKVEDGEEEGGVSTEQSLKFYDWNAKILFKPIPNSLITYGFLQTSNNFDYESSFSDGEDISRDMVSNHSTIHNFSIQFNPNKNFSAGFSISTSAYESGSLFNYSEFLDSLPTFSQLLANDIFDEKINLEFSWNNQKNIVMEMGYNYSMKRVSLTIDEFYEFEEDYFLLEELEGRFNNFFYSFDWFNKKWLLNIGARLTQFQDINRWYLSPRFNLQYAVTKDFKLKAAAGRMNQFIGQLGGIDNTELNPNNPLWILTNFEEGTPLTTTKYSLGFLFEKDGWLIDVDVFNNATKGINTITNKLGNVINQIDNIFGNSVTSGVDVLLKKRWKFYNLWVNYSYNFSRFNFPELDIPAFPTNNDLRHSLSIANTFSYKKFQLTLNWQYRTGTPFTEPIGIEEEEEGDFFIEYEQINNKRYPIFNRFDIGLQYITEIPNTNMSIESSFSIINVFDNETPFFVEYYIDQDDEEPDEEPELFSFQKYLLGRTPQFLIRLYW